MKEIEDSDDDSNVEVDDDDVDDRRIEVLRSQARSKSNPATSLRQTTLPELFKAVA